MKKFHFFNLSLKSNYFGESTKPLGPLCLWQCFASAGLPFFPLFLLELFTFVPFTMLQPLSAAGVVDADRLAVGILGFCSTLNCVLLCSTLQSTLRSTLTFVHFELRARTWKRMPRVDPVSPISKNFPILMFLAMTTT